MKKSLFIGCGTALVTPFTEDGINFEELKRLLEFQIEQGVDSIIICGTTGESSTMSIQEKKDVIEFTVKVVNKRIPVIAGAGGNNTKEVIKLSEYAEESGVDGLLLVTPYYNKTTQAGLIAHYTEIASNVSLPIILYNPCFIASSLDMVFIVLKSVILFTSSIIPLSIGDTICAPSSQ